MSYWLLLFWVATATATPFVILPLVRADIRRTLARLNTLVVASLIALEERLWHLEINAASACHHVSQLWHRSFSPRHGDDPSREPGGGAEE